MIHPDPSNGLHISPQSSPPLSKGGMVQVTDAAAVPQPGYSSDETVSLRELIQNTGFWRAQEIKPWIRPSPTMWRFALMLGDGSLLLALLLVCAPALQVGLNAADLESSRGNTQLIWICLALVSWGIAVKIAQSQELINASNRLRSLLSTVFAILLMLLFWMLLSYPFIADEGISYVKMSLIFGVPVMALLIRLDSPGPIFYSQERLGYQGKKFRVLKFRSMCRDAECAGCAVWAAKGDRRVTRVGRILRATHLDELPQVLNILRGEMSLVGPRPEREEFVTPLEKTIPFYRCRLSVKPGLTGWAQVKYPYTSSDYKMLIKLQYDLYYIKHQSFVLDICIILQTVREMLLCHGR